MSEAKRYYRLESLADILYLQVFEPVKETKHYVFLKRIGSLQIDESYHTHYTPYNQDEPNNMYRYTDDKIYRSQISACRPYASDTVKGAIQAKAKRNLRRNRILNEQIEYANRIGYLVNQGADDVLAAANRALEVKL